MSLAFKHATVYRLHSIKAPIFFYFLSKTNKKDADDLADFTSMPNLDNVKIPSEQLDKLPVSCCCVSLTII